jgi:hypothetical protein
MIKGEYRLIQDGEVIDVAHNLITSTGKKQLLQFIGRVRDGWAETMAFGTVNTAPNSSNQWMGNEIYSCPVSVARVDTDAGTIVLKSEIEIDSDFRFSEIGLRPSKTYKEPGVDPVTKLTNFPDTEQLLTTGSPVGFRYKSDTSAFAGSTYGAWVKDGSSSLELGPLTSATLNYEVDLSGYPTTSKIVVGVVTTDSSYGAEPYNTELKFVVAGSGGTKFFSHDLSGSSTNAYNVEAVSLSSFVAEGGATAADWRNIGEIRIENYSGYTQLWDTIKIERQDNTDLSDVCFSRAVFSPEKNKAAGVPLELEYVVTLGL